MRSRYFCLSDGLFHPLPPRREEFDGVDGVDFVAGGDEAGQVLGHGTGLDGVEAGALESVGKAAELGSVVQLAALAQGARPGKNGRHGI